jgi:hypothetical protein
VVERGLGDHNARAAEPGHGRVAWDRDVEVEWGLGLRACMGRLVWAGLKEQ